MIAVSSSAIYAVTSLAALSTSSAIWSDLLETSHASEILLLTFSVSCAATRIFSAIALVYSHIGRPSIAPEQLLRAHLLQAFYSIRSERKFMEQLDFNLLCRCFVDLGVDDQVWDTSTFCKKRDHFSMDGTLINGWASMKSFRPKSGGGGVSVASGTAEREAALELPDAHRPMNAQGGKLRITLAGDKGFDVADFIETLRELKMTPHVAVQDHLTKIGKRRKSKIDGRTTHYPGHRIEEIFGWVKIQGGQGTTKISEPRASAYLLHSGPDRL